MRSLIPAALIASLLIGCNGNEDPETPPSNQNKMKSHFIVTDRNGSNSYEIEQAVYGLFRYSYGYELTLNLESPLVGQMGESPRFEVSVFFPNRPKISEGSKWTNQPGEIDREHLGIMSNFYRFTHDSFDQFSIEVVEVVEDGLICKVEGTVAATASTVSAFAKFEAGGWQREEAQEEGEQAGHGDGE